MSEYNFSKEVYCYEDFRDDTRQIMSLIFGNEETISEVVSQEVLERWCKNVH